MTTAPKKRGRPPGTKLGPRVGSRPWKLAQMMPGDRIFLEAPGGNLQNFMKQIGADISRGGLSGLVTQTLILGIEPATRNVIDLVMLTRKEIE